MRADEARAIVYAKESENDITEVVKRIKMAAEIRRTYLFIEDLTHGQQQALKELGYKVTRTTDQWHIAWG